MQQNLPDREEPLRGAVARTFAFLRHTFKTTPSVFISYRRADTAPYASKIYEGLVTALGKANVFFDKQDINLGDRFGKVIKRRVNSCQILLVLVGQEWLNPPDEKGDRRHRLEEPDDYVRLEIEAGLKRGDDFRVIPVLVHGAHMPAQSEIPASMAAFAGCAAHEIRDTQLEEDIGVLTEKILGVRPGLVEVMKTERFRRRALPFFLSAVLVAFVAGWMQLLDLKIVGIDALVANSIMALGDSIDRRPPSEKVALIAITKETERRFKKGFDKTWRHEHSKLIKALADAGASLIVFDLFLDDPSNYDQELIAAVDYARSKGTAVVFGTERGSTAVPGLEDASARLGLLCIGGAQGLGYATLATLAVKRGSQYLPSITALAFVPGATIKEIDFEDRKIQVQDSMGNFQVIRFSDYERISRPRKSCPALVKGDTVTQLIIHLSPLDMWRNAPKRHEYEEFFNAAGILPADRYKGKILLVGREDSNDEFQVRYGLHSETRYGFELQADAVDTLVQRIDIHPLAREWQFCAALFMAYLGQWAILSRPFKRRSVRYLYNSAVVVCYMVVSTWLYLQSRILLDLYPLVAFFLTYFISVWRARRLGLW